MTRDGLDWLKRKGEASKAQSEAAKLERELRAKREKRDDARSD